MLSDARSTSAPSERKMDGNHANEAVASKIEGLMVEGDEGDDGSAASELSVRGNDDGDPPHPHQRQPFVPELVDMAGEVLRYRTAPRFVCVFAAVLVVYTLL